MTSDDVEIELASGERMPAYLAKPAGQPALSGIVLLQEIFGINANMRGIADDYARRGYNAIAPDLFWRQERGVQLDPSKEGDRERATELMKGLDQRLAVEDSLAAANYLRSLAGSSAKIGAVGYCLGGKLAYLLATKGIDAAVSYYGVMIQTVLDQAAELNSPLLLHIAEEDHLCPPEAQQAILEALKDRAEVTILKYPGVGHAFARRGGASFDSASAERADRKTAEFLERTLRTAG